MTDNSKFEDFYSHDDDDDQGEGGAGQFHLSDRRTFLETIITNMADTLLVLPEDQQVQALELASNAEIDPHVREELDRRTQEIIEQLKTQLNAQQVPGRHVNKSDVTVMIDILNQIREAVKEQSLRASHSMSLRRG